MLPHPYHLRDHAAGTYRPHRPGRGILVDFLDDEDNAGRSVWIA